MSPIPFSARVELNEVDGNGTHWKKKKHVSKMIILVVNLFHLYCEVICKECEFLNSLHDFVLECYKEGMTIYAVIVCECGFMTLFLSAMSTVRVPHASSRWEYKECLLYFGKSRDSGLFACSLCAADVSPWLWKWDCALFTIGVYQFQYFWMSCGILTWPLHNFLRLGFVSFSKELDRRFDGLAWGCFNCDIRFPLGSKSFSEAIYNQENGRTGADYKVSFLKGMSYFPGIHSYVRVYMPKVRLLVTSRRNISVSDEHRVGIVSTASWGPGFTSRLGYYERPLSWFPSVPPQKNLIK
jgi:hypothetical protein